MGTAASVGNLHNKVIPPPSGKTSMRIHLIILLIVSSYPADCPADGVAHGSDLLLATKMACWTQH